MNAQTADIIVKVMRTIRANADEPFLLIYGPRRGPALAAVVAQGVTREDLVLIAARTLAIFSDAAVDLGRAAGADDEIKFMIEVHSRMATLTGSEATLSGRIVRIEPSIAPDSMNPSKRKEP